MVEIVGSLLIGQCRRTNHISVIYLAAGEGCCGSRRWSGGCSEEDAAGAEVHLGQRDQDDHRGRHPHRDGRGQEGGQGELGKIPSAAGAVFITGPFFTDFSP